MTKEFLPGLIGTQRLTHDMSIPHGGSPATKAAKPREDRGRPDQHGSGQSSKGHPCRSPEMASSAKQGECCTLGDQRDKPRWQATQSRGQHTPQHTHTHTHRHGRRRDHAWGALGPQRAPSPREVPLPHYSTRANYPSPGNLGPPIYIERDVFIVCFVSLWATPESYCDQFGIKLESF